MISTISAGDGAGQNTPPPGQPFQNLAVSRASAVAGCGDELALQRLLSHRIEFSRTEGSRQSLLGWWPTEMTLGEFVTECAQPSLVGPKVFCPAHIVDGWRDPLTAFATDFVVIEDNTGVSLEELLARLRDLGLAALVQATREHQRTTTLVKQTEFDCWAAGEPNAASLQEVLRSQFGIATEVLDVEPATHEGCPAHLLRHTPISAYRAILPLARRFCFRSEGAMDAWADLMMWVQDQLHPALMPRDRTPSQAFYFETADALAAWTDGDFLSV